MESLIKGMDLSTLLEVEARGGRFTDHGTPRDAMEILKSYGMNLVRLRLWNNPYSPQGEPYGAGGCDLPRVMTLARRAKNLGVDWMLCLHYSDFWADPGKQYPPKAWQDLDEADLENAVYNYTRAVLTVLREADLLPSWVAVGNELSNGLLWPLGRTPNYKNIARFVSAGILAVRETAAAAKVMIHLDNGGNNQLYRTWFDRYLDNGGADFDCIGMSYYPFWHGTMSELSANMDDIALRYHKDLFVAELSTGFTLEDYQQYEKLPSEQRRGPAANARLAELVSYPMTPEGQCGFFQAIGQVLRQVPEERGKGFICWEPAWIPVPGSHWATAAGAEYIHERRPGGNEWANQALFDYDGRSLPVLESIRAL